MHTLFNLPVWLLFVALASPLALMAWSVRSASQELSRRPIDEPENISEGPITYHNDGTRTQTFTIRLPLHQTVAVTRSFGPIAISANGRVWAANAILLGLALVFVGMVGLFHFPVVNHPPIDAATIENHRDNKQ